MPRELGTRHHDPDRIVLSLFGIACCRGAQPLLKRYMQALKLALQRHDQPELPNVLSRSDVVEALSIGPVEADRLSKLILLDAPFLAGGDAGVDSWSLDIDERIVAYEHAEDVSEFLLQVATERATPAPSLTPNYPSHDATAGLPVAPGQTSELRAAKSSRVDKADADPAPPRPGREGVPAVVTAVAVVAAAAANIVSLAVAPLPLALGAAAASLAAAATHRKLLRPQPSAVAMGAVLAIGGVVAISTWLIGGDTQGKQLTIIQQIDRELEHAAAEKRYPAFQRRARLHGAGSESHVVVLRDEQLRDRLRPSDLLPQRSDEIRIYDIEGDKVVRRFRWESQFAGRIRQGPEGDYPPFLFRVQDVKDFDGNGRAEIIGAFERITLASGPFPVPVVISWDDGAGAYRLSPLLRAPPPIVKPPVGGDYSIYAGHTAQTLLQNAVGDGAVRAYPVSEYNVSSGPRAPVLAAGFLIDAGVGPAAGRYELRAWFLDLQTSEARAVECFPEMSTDHVLVNPGERRPRELLVRTLRRKSACRE
jgi:hypothetical protein